MFTGLIEEVGLLRKVRRKDSGLSITVEAGLILNDVNPGDSISVNGACLTVEVISGREISFHAVKDTLKDTALSELKVNDKINLERALRADSRIGGHFVYGHVDAPARIFKKSRSGIVIRVPEALKIYIVPKGSVAVDGISLTVQSVRGNQAEIAVIPHTWANTNLSSKKTGDSVNIEVDFMLKQVITLGKKYGLSNPEQKNGF